MAPGHDRRHSAGKPGSADENALTPRVLFVCGSLNQTTQLHHVARHLPEARAAFSPFYTRPFIDWCAGLGLLEFTISGRAARKRCIDYLTANGLNVDDRGARGGYHLIVTCTDVALPYNLNGAPLVVVQEGMLDPEGFLFRLGRRFPSLPLWLSGTANTGLSEAYTRFCAASEGYREHFIRNGAPADRVVVTGMPNFDDCACYRNNGFPLRDYVLVCTSDARETFKLDDRRRFVEKAVRIAAGRKLVFKLHPNENVRRATREIRRYAPQALIYATGTTEEMIANSCELVCQYSSTAFVGLALGKPVHSYFDDAELRRLLPEQNRSAARKIASVCREVLREAGHTAPAVRHLEVA